MIANVLQVQPQMILGLISDIHGNLAALKAVLADMETKGHSIGPNDLLIAATALARGAVLVTHNVKESNASTVWSGRTGRFNDWKNPGWRPWPFYQAP